MSQFKDFRTTIDPIEAPKELRYGDRIMMLGSCFTNNIGDRLKRVKFDTMVNPLGILYNPSSLASALERIVDGRTLEEEDIEWFGNSYGSFEFHSDFNRVSKQECLDLINRTIVEAHEYIKKCQHLFITFGTSYIYERKSTGSIVGNCHKQPEKEFKRFRLSPSEVVMNWADILKRVWAVNPNIQVTFTVSPIRHLRDGAVGNQRSKSVLLLSIDRLIEGYSKKNIGYYPAYEIMMDDLRDYRFYAKDMVHPSDLAVDYIWDHFLKCHITEETRVLMQKINKIVMSASHRPINPNGNEYKVFVSRLLSRIEELSSIYPEIDFSDIIHQFN
ncbi:GSCFA domain-containing protein [Halosquirtibacter laminarini]|uniref:GSCFA domain-containing protein n=1 Tax=Halosquirtibacter laminarini TaxID=3374600 RepID=A0AC61NKN9_9BACT|nr:GSCFA domain-containing protein [Prolixibacteraceae bacterium]